jgi:hypothetical protein
VNRGGQPPDSKGTTVRVPHVRELTSKERLLLERLLLHGTAESRGYIEQFPEVTVASRCGCGCPTVDLAVGGRVASLRSPSVILSEARCRRKCLRGRYPSSYMAEKD